MRAHVFPGVGRQKKGMAADLFRDFPDLSRRAEAILGWSVEELCRDNLHRRLVRSEYSQPVTFVVNALHQQARRDLPPPDYLAGHSLGEYNALYAAGVVDFDTGLRLVQRRAKLMGAISGSGMVAVVGTSLDAVNELLRTDEATGVVIANYNAPDQFVLAGTTEALQRIRPLVVARHGEDSVIPLNAGGIASHSPLMADASAAFREFLRTVELVAPHTPVLSNVTGRPYGSDPQAIASALADQIVRPVRWVECVRYLHRAGVTEFVELGENDTLTKFVAKIMAVEPPAESPAPDIDRARVDSVGRNKRDVVAPEMGGAAPTPPDDTGPWHDYRDERVVALLRAGMAGTVGVDDLIETIRAGMPAATQVDAR